MKSHYIAAILNTCHNVAERHHIGDLSPAMLTHPTITTSSVRVDSWRQNAAIDIRWTLVRIIEEEARHQAWVSVREGQHKGDNQLHEKLHP